MNIIKALILLLCPNLYCQTAIIDSAGVKFKANLFTVSEYGIASRNQILKDIEAQKVKFLKTKYKNFSFLKIDFSQPYRYEDNVSTTNLFRDCSYYVAFNHNINKFYKLGGFDAVDIDDFINDLEIAEIMNPIDWDVINIIEEIDIECLYEYFNLNKKQRLKRNFTCFENCKQKTRSHY